MTTPKLASNVIRLLGNFPVSQVAGCTCTLLAGNSTTSVAVSEVQINFSQQSPKMRNMASESFSHALLLFLVFFFSKIPVELCWVHLHEVTTKIMAIHYKQEKHRTRNHVNNEG